MGAATAAEDATDGQLIAVKVDGKLTAAPRTEVGALIAI
jgi:hypothetical protein